MSRYCKKDNRPWGIRYTILAVLLLPIYWVPSVNAELADGSVAMGLIFIDPGHGGKDTGARKADIFKRGGGESRP